MLKLALVIESYQNVTFTCLKPTYL